MFTYSTKNEFLNDLETYLKTETKLFPSSQRIYLRRIEKILENNCSVADLCGGIDNAVRRHGVGGDQYDPSDSGNTRAALQRVRAFVRKKLLEDCGGLHISYETGWGSFVPQDKHLTAYEIEDGTITARYAKGFTPLAGTKTKDIPTRDLDYLIHLLSEGKRRGHLSASGTAITTTHGNIHYFGYDFGGKSGRKCAALFEDDKKNAAYHAIIDPLV